MSSDLVRVAFFWMGLAIMIAVIAIRIFHHYFPIRRTRGRPWLERGDWRAGVVRWDPRGQLLSLVLQLVLLAVMASAFVMMTDFDKWVRIIIPIGFALALVQPFQTYLRQRAIGNASFTFEQIPFILGDHLKGTLRIERGDAVFALRVLLACFHRGSHTFQFDWDESVPPWSQRRLVQPGAMRPRGSAVEIDVDFELPRDHLPTVLRGLRRVYWEVSVWEGSNDNALAVMAFRVPVFGAEVASLRAPTAVARAKKRALDRSLSVFDDRP